MSKEHHFNSIKVRLELELALVVLAWVVHFNSIKVRLEPIEAMPEKPIPTVGLRVQRYKKIFRKMSMPKDIFSAGLRQPAYLWRFQ